MADFPFQKEVDAFLESKAVDRGAADHTLQAYRRDLQEFQSWASGTTHLKDLNPENLDEFISHLAHCRLKASSIARKISALRQFFKFCCLELDLEKNPSEQLVTPLLPKRLPKALGMDDVQKLLVTADQGLPYQGRLRPVLQSRDSVMVYLLYATGLRISELTSLQQKDLDLEAAYARVIGKGGKERIAPFAGLAGERLSVYLAQDRPQLNPVTDHLFINHRGLALTRQTCWSIIKDLAGVAGITQTLSPHILRHSFATHLLRSGMNLRSLQMLLGHSDLSTTQLYTHITPEHLKSAHRKFHPRGE